MNLFTIALMQKPWGIIGSSFAGGAILLLIVATLIGRKISNNDKLYSRIIFIIGLALLSMEITHEIERYIELGRYDWSSFPFQMCSIPMYLSLALPFIKHKKAKNYFIVFFATFTLISGTLPLFFGQAALLRWTSLYGKLFSFIWHLILLFIGALSIGFINMGRSFKLEIKPLIGASLIFILITCIAQLLNVSIHYLAGGFTVSPGTIKEVGYISLYELDPDSASLFYISPYFKSNIGIGFDYIWLRLGWIMCWIIYDIMFIVAEMIAYLLSYTIRRLCRLINRPRAQKIVIE